jgi:cytoskeletal protein RodZ
VVVVVEVVVVGASVVVVVVASVVVVVVLAVVLVVVGASVVVVVVAGVAHESITSRARHAEVECSTDPNENVRAVALASPPTAIETTSSSPESRPPSSGLDTVDPAAPPVNVHATPAGDASQAGPGRELPLFAHILAGDTCRTSAATEPDDAAP